MKAWLLLATAGAIGTALRHAVGVSLAHALGGAFPIGTWTVNVVGSFALGLVAGALTGSTLFGVDARLVLGVGLLGGFTTYSSFNLELLRLLEQGQWGRASLYLVGTVIGALLAGALGLLAGRTLAAGPRS